MKKIISAMLLITVLFASFPVWQPATAIELDDDIGFEYRDEVYYSDLFTMYSQYLYEDGMAEIVNDDYQKVLSEVYEDFKNNSDYYSMIYAYGFTSSISNFIKAFTDATGTTDFTYKDALDAANELFVTELFGNEAVTETLGADMRIMEYLNLGSQMFDDCLKELSLKMTYEKILDEPEHILVWCKNTGVHYFEKSHSKTVTEVFTYASENLDLVVKAFSAGKTALDIGKAIYLAIVMECVRYDIINDILAYAEAGTALYDGLSRLENQLGNNIVDYFINTYIIKEGIKVFEKAVEEWVIGKIVSPENVSSINTLSLVLKAAGHITYDLILNVPQFSEVTSYIVLVHYADDLCACIKRMQLDLATGVHDGHTVTRYENLWAVYGATYKAVLNHGEKLLVDDSSLKLKSAYNKYFGNNYNLYSRTINRILDNIRSTPFDERLINPPEDMAYVSTSLENSDIAPASNVVSDNTIYLVNGYLYGCLNVRGNDVSLDDVLKRAKGIAGDLTVYGVTLIVDGDKTYTVDGNMLMHGYYDYAWNGYAYYYGTVDVQSKLIVTGDISNKDDSNYYRFKMSSENAKLDLYGDQLIGLYTHAGTVVFCGNQQQKMIGNHKNIYVTNPEGVVGDISLHGHFEAYSNPVCGNATLFGNATVSDNTRFSTVTVSSDYTMKSNINADTVYVFEETLTVPEDCAYTIDGDIFLYGSYSNAGGGSTYYNGTLDIKGDLTVTGDISVKDDNRYYSFTMTDENAVLRLLGDQNVSMDTYKGTVVFCGTEQQKIQGRHKNIIVTNPVGVIGNITLYGELDSNSNPFDGSVTLSGTAALTEDTRLPEVRIASKYTMQCNIYADTLYIDSYTMTVPAGSAYIVSGDIVLSGSYSNAGGGSTYYKGTVDVQGDLEVFGNISYSGDSRYVDLKINGSDAILRLHGESNVARSLTQGTVVYCGTTQQTVSGTYNNILVTNPEGVTGSVSLNGNFNSNGNPFDGSVYLFSDATLSDDGTNYKEVYITKDFTLKSNIYADTVHIDASHLTVAEGTKYVIDANIDINGYYDYGYHRASMKVYGDLTVTGDITKTYYGSITVYENSVLRFAGDSGQTVNGLGNVYTIILENESDEGVTFTSDIRVLTLFDHKRNNYTVGASSIFADYDGDGKPDNEDKVPTAVCGDINCDGKVNGIDSNFLSRIVAGSLYDLTDENRINADYNEDGKINAIDANLLLKLMTGSIQ